MAEADRRRWNERYGRSVDRGWSPRPFLVDATPWLPAAGRALDLACGPGDEALWLARRGLAVDAVDISDVALRAAGRRAERLIGPAAARVRFIAADLDAGVPPACSGPYALICALHFRGAVFDEALGNVMAPGGVVVATRLSVVGRDAPEMSGAGPSGGPDPAFLAEPGELVALARRHGLVVDHHVEGGGQAGLVAHRPLPSTAGAGSGHAADADHEAGRQLVGRPPARP